MAIGTCKQCKESIDVGDVFKTVELQQSPQHVALIYKCPSCEQTAKVVATHEQWDEKQEEYEVRQAKRERDSRADQIELDAIQGPSDLVAYWASLKNPPLIEEHIGKCVCQECRKRLYG